MGVEEDDVQDAGPPIPLPLLVLSFVLYVCETGGGEDRGDREGEAGETGATGSAAVEGVAEGTGGM